MKFFQFLLLLLVTPAALCQSTHADASTSELISKAVANYSANKQQADAFTYDELWRNQDFEHGKLKADRSAQFESIFIDDLPYLRKVAENGKPLTGNAARQEQEKYEEAVKARQGMTLQQKQGEMQVNSLAFPIHLHLIPTLYTNQVVGTDTLNGRPAVHIDCVPLTGIVPKNEEESQALSVHLQIWIDVQDQIISRFDGELIRPMNGMLPGSAASATYAPVDGVWLPSHSNVRGELKPGKSIVSFDTDLTYSDFQKFSVDVRVFDGTSEIQASN
jgi:hypothetical protein